MLNIVNIVWGAGQDQVVGEQVYVIDNNIASIALHAVGGDVSIMIESGGSTWTMKDGDKEEIVDRSLGGHKLYFNASEGAKLEIRPISGLMC